MNILEQQLTHLVEFTPNKRLHSQIMAGVTRSNRQTDRWLFVISGFVFASSLIGLLTSSNFSDSLQVLRLAALSFQLNWSYFLDFSRLLLDTVPLISFFNLLSVTFLTIFIVRTKHIQLADMFHFAHRQSPNDLEHS